MRAPARPAPPPAPPLPLLLLLLLLLSRGLFSEPLPLGARAEEAEAETYAEAEAEEPPEGCCLRLPRLEPLHDGEGGSVDVGHCSRSCRRSFLDADAESQANVSDEAGACPGPWQCETARAALRAEAVGGEERELRVAEGCACRPRAAPCARRPLALRLFADTPFETTVDVGACAGRCAHGGGGGGQGCRAVQRRSVAVEGPNGARCLQVVERCACADACFRVRRLRVVGDFEGEGGALLAHPMLKEVDVGACEGACEAGAGAGAGARRCADPFWRAPAPCRSWLVERRHARARPSCAPARTSTRHYTARDGERRRLLVVERCACA